MYIQSQQVGYLLECVLHPHLMGLHSCMMFQDFGPKCKPSEIAQDMQLFTIKHASLSVNTYSHGLTQSNNIR